MNPLNSYLQKLEEAAKEASQGYWGAGEAGPWGGQGYYVSPGQRKIGDTCAMEDDGTFVVKENTNLASANAHYIRTANPATVLKLCSAMRMAMEELESLRSKSRWVETILNSINDLFKEEI